MAELIIYRSAAQFVIVKIGENTVFTSKLMGEHKISSTFETLEPIDFILGDYIQHNGNIYRLNQIPELIKQSRRRFIYSAVFEGPEYKLYNKLLQHLGNSDFSFHGTPLTFLQLIINNANQIDPGWTIGDYDTTEEGQTLTFQNDSCRTALTKVAEAFGLEYNFNTKVIHLKKAVGSVVSGLTLQYGKGNGLYTLTRQTSSDEKVFTRVFGYGGSTNLPENYREGLKRLTFANRKIERNINVYGEIEVAVNFDYIFPRRTAQITSSPSILEVIDTTLDFNLNDVIVQGQAKIVFKTGDLGGNEFEILTYDNSTKRIKFKANTDENGYTLPNNTVKANVGDDYTLVGIEMPQAYIDAAELEVQEATIEFAEAYKNPLLSFGLEIDEKFIRDNSLTGQIKTGDRIHVIANDLGVNSHLRVQEVSYPKIKPSKIKAIISDKVSYTVGETLLKEVKKQKEQITIVYKTIDEKNRDLSIKFREFQDSIFDPEDGYFDGGRIKPETVEAIHLAVGTRSQDFSLSTILRPNYQGDPDQIYWDAGALVHNTIDPNAIKTWSIASGSKLDLFPSNGYYIYAKCGKATLDGIIVFDLTKRRVNDDPSFYYFLIGFLSSEINGVRWPSLSYGISELNGRFLTTGRVQSRDGETYFDLDAGVFRGKLEFTNGTSVENGIKNAVDAVKIGGRNLFRGFPTNAILNIANSDYYTDYYANIPLEPNTEYTFSFNYNVVSGDFAKLRTGFGYGNLNTYNADIIGWSTNLISNNVFTFKTPAVLPFPYFQWRPWLNFDNDSSSFDVDFWNIKFEKGNKKSDWQPAPEDVQFGIDAVAIAANNALVNANDAKNFIDNILPVELQDIRDQLDGVIQSWFDNHLPTLSNHPAVDWTTNSLKDDHLGDLFYNNTSGLGYRFSKDGSDYVWTELNDTDAAAALALAQQAKDTADGKRRVFVVTPFTPYDAGDLWSQGPTGELMRCISSRLTGSYNASDWTKSSKYTDDTVANQALSAANNAQSDINAARIELNNVISVTERIEGITGFLSTTIDNNVVATGVLLVGDASGNNNAGISGLVDSTPGLSVRFWSGALFSNRNSAPFRVLQNGKVFMMDAEIQGNITAGTVGGWIINSTSISSPSLGFGNVSKMRLDATSGEISLNGNTLGSASYITPNGMLILAGDGYFVSTIGASVAGLFRVNGDPLQFYEESKVALCSYVSGGYGYAAKLMGLVEIGGGIILPYKDVSGNYVITHEDYHINATVAGSTIYMPNGPRKGRRIKISRTVGSITLSGNGKNIQVKGGTPSSSKALLSFMEEYVYTGTLWMHDSVLPL
jgi:hypothetical protein